MTQPISDEAKELAAGYVLGELDAEEETRLQHLLRENPALTKEVQALSAVYRRLPQALPKVEPPAELRSRILSAQAKLDSERPMPAAVDDEPDMLRERRNLRWAVAGRSRSAGRLSIPGRAIAAAAAGFAILALGLDNLRLRQQMAGSGQNGGGVEPGAIATILQQPNSRLISLQDPNAPAVGTVLFTPGRWDEVVVAMENLPALPPDQTYRMWLRLQDGTLILCGEFVPDSQGRVFAKLTPPQQPTPDNKAASVLLLMTP